MSEIEVELEFVFGMDFGDLGKGRWEKNRIGDLDTHP
jgi:hypothetical protein